MRRRLLFVSMVLLAAPAAAAAGERPLFDFRGELPVPGGTMRLEARCVEGADGLHCRAGTRAPSGRGFQFEGRFRTLPPAPPDPEKTEPSQNAPRWF